MGRGWVAAGEVTHETLKSVRAKIFKNSVSAFTCLPSDNPGKEPAVSSFTVKGLCEGHRQVKPLASVG